jgi:hypothetical protein
MPMALLAPVARIILALSSSFSTINILDTKGKEAGVEIN